jgi:hypothetical protein
MRIWSSIRWHIYDRPRWFIWSIQHRHELREIKELERNGHHPHCATRQVWGDGECECADIKSGYDPYKWVERAIETK